MARAGSFSEIAMIDEKELAEKRRLKQMTPMDKVREAVVKESFTVKHLGNMFRLFDDDGNQRINFKEFKTGLHDMHLKLTVDVIRDLYAVFDKDCSGSIDFNEFLVALRPPLPPERRVLVDEAFHKLDRTGDGVITIADIKMIYNQEDNPLLDSNEWKGAKGLESLVKTFSGPSGQVKDVTRRDFTEYYCGLSCTMKDDGQFIKMLQHSWNLKPKNAE